MTASLWSASAPECPWVPIGTSAASARIATKKVAVHDRTAKVSTVRMAPATVVMSQVRPSSVSTRKRPELRPELRAGADRRVERVDEGEESGRGGRDGEDRRRDGCRIQRDVELALAGAQGEQRGDEHPDHARGREVDEQPGDRKPPAHERTGVADREGRGAAAVGERPHHHHERGHDEDRGPGGPQRARLHPLTLRGAPAAGRLPSLRDPARRAYRREHVATPVACRSAKHASSPTDRGSRPGMKKGDAARHPPS